MGVTNHLELVKQAHAEFGPLTSHERCCLFTEFVVKRINAVDPDIGHLKKAAGQSSYNGHAVDAALSKSTGQAIDLIGASKIASPATPATAALGVEDAARYTKADWIDPATITIAPDTTDPPRPAPSPPPAPPPPPHVCPIGVPRHTYTEQLTLAADLDAAYRAAASSAAHPDALAHWLWRYQFENFTREQLLAEATKRGVEEAPGDTGAPS